MNSKGEVFFHCRFIYYICPMQLSIIILNYNVRYFLELCIDSVIKATKDIDAEIIVVDNNSPDDSCAMVRERFPQITLIENKENAGFPKGNNIGVASAKGKYICILNPDTVVAEDTFTSILEFAEAEANLGIVGCRLIDGRGNFLAESKRGVPTPFVAFTKVTALYKIFPKVEAFNQYYMSSVAEFNLAKAEILVGAFMIMKRSLYLEVGGFDEDCFMYSDDIDLSYMVFKTGRDNYYFPKTSVIHYKGESTIKDGTYMNRFRDAMNFFYKKHFKVSATFNIMMKMGSYFFMIAKRTKKGKPVIIDEYNLVSKDPILFERLQRQLQKKVYLRELSDLKISDNHTQFIYDTNSLSYKEILDSMQALKSENSSFKMAFAEFIIGSNSSDDRGEVILIEKETA